MTGVNSSVLPSLVPLPLDLVLRERARRGLVAVFDFDGTLVPISRTPDAVEAAPDIARLIETLARRPDTTVGVVSGRPLDALVRRIDAPSAWLFGLHGWEERAPGGDVVRRWPPGAFDRARRQLDEVRRRLARIDGVMLEDKGLMIAVHTRNVADVQRAEVGRAVDEARLPGFELVSGRRVLELRPARARTKGTAVRRIAATRPGACIVYVGDDTTDEDAFAALDGRDFAVVVDDDEARTERPGGSCTRARYTLAGPAFVIDALNLLVSGASCPP